MLGARIQSLHLQRLQNPEILHSNKICTHTMNNGLPKKVWRYIWGFSLFFLHNCLFTIAKSLQTMRQALHTLVWQEFLTILHIVKSFSKGKDCKHFKTRILRKWNFQRVLNFLGEVTVPMYIKPAQCVIKWYCMWNQSKNYKKSRNKPFGLLFRVLVLESFAAKAWDGVFCSVCSADTLTNFAFASNLSTSLTSIWPGRIRLKGLQGSWTRKSWCAKMRSC